MLSAARREVCVAGAMRRHNISQRRACRALQLSRSGVRYKKRVRSDEERLRHDIKALSMKHKRYGYKRITALLRRDGWRVNRKRVERIWREEGLRVPKRRQKRKRIRTHDGSCIRLRPQHRNHVWSYDFVEDRLSNGRKLRFLTIIDEHSRKCLAIKVAHRLGSKAVQDALFELFLTEGIPQHIRSDNGPEFIAKSLQKWLAETGVKTAYITPGSPWENGYIEGFNSRLRDEFLSLEWFDSLAETKVLTDLWRRDYNHIRPHSTLGYKTPMEAIAAETKKANMEGRGCSATLHTHALPCYSPAAKSVLKTGLEIGG